MTIEVGATGHAPTVLIKPYNPERSKYTRLWAMDEYRSDGSPGESWAATFLEQARPKPDAEVIDFGCGSGRGGLMLALMGQMKVTMLDFAGNCLDEDVANACRTQAGRIRFLEHDLTEVPQCNAVYGYCTDVMEHVPEPDVPKVLANILASAQHVFFAISTRPDVNGRLIGAPLHMTVKPASWWVEQITAQGALVHWIEERHDCVALYVSSWPSVKDVVRTGRVNTDKDTIEKQTADNIRAKYQQVVPHEVQEREVVLLCGGPSMNDHVDEIRQLRADGAALVTVNGAYNWAIERGLSPSATVVVDAREFNARFVLPVVPTCRYLLASQVHPKTVQSVPRDQVWQWHSGLSAENEALQRETHGHFFPTAGGSTVTLRAIPLLRMLGFYKFHVFGFDSCVRQDAHHAYAQAENDGDSLIPVTCNNRLFNCTPWMTSQASEFAEIVNLLGDEIELEVYGDGLIAEMIRAGATFTVKE